MHHGCKGKGILKNTEEWLLEIKGRPGERKSSDRSENILQMPSAGWFICHQKVFAAEYANFGVVCNCLINNELRDWVAYFRLFVGLFLCF